MDERKQQTINDLYKYLLEVKVREGKELKDGQVLLVFAANAPADKCTAMIAGHGGEVLSGIGTVIEAAADQMEVPPSKICEMLGMMLADAGGPYKVTTEKLYGRN